MVGGAALPSIEQEKISNCSSTGSSPAHALLQIVQSPQTEGSLGLSSACQDEMTDLPTHPSGKLACMGCSEVGADLIRISSHP